MSRDPGSGARPVEPSERVQSLDVLRGFALLGIIVVNIVDYAPEDSTTGPDLMVLRLVNLLATGSFYPLFSLLFGIGFAIFLDRAAARGASGAWLFLRRALGLFLIAIFQIVFLEDRDILVRYSMLSVPLLLFWRAPARVCFGAAVVCLALAVARPAILRERNERSMADPGRTAAMREAERAAREDAAARSAAWRTVESSGSYGKAIVYRARWDVPDRIEGSVAFLRNRTLFHILAMFLFGAAAWRSGVFTRNLPSRTLLKRWAWGGIVVGVVGNLVMSLGPDRGPLPFVATYPISTAVHQLGDLALTVGYAAAVLRFLPPPGNRLPRWAAAIAPVGRMGLTNYLWQSLMMAVLFLPYGFALAGKLSLWLTVLLALPIWLSHLPLSSLWLARHRLGPMEQVWRTFTYGRRTH